VEDGNIELLTDKICTLIEDSKLRSRFSEAAINQAKGFNEDVIMEMWNSLFKTLIQQKRK
jgi:glycosyltransferase involved in cell wall biosynthesis